MPLFPRQGEGGTLNCAPSADAVAGNGACSSVPGQTCCNRKWYVPPLLHDLATNAEALLRHWQYIGRDDVVYH
jgi:hypothetical protein